MKASAWDKFLLLSWKNWIIQLRHPIQTLFEILVPVLVCGLLILIRGLVEVTEFETDIFYPPLSASLIGGNILFSDVNKVLAYSPRNPVLQNVVQNAAAEFGFLAYGVEDAETLESFAMASVPFASIEFEDSLKDIDRLPSVVNYAIRFPAELRTNNSQEERFGGFFFNWRTNFKLADEFASGPRNKENDDGGNPPGYINVNMLGILILILTVN
jgi:ATP-binding cassette subfamily A (ABC1) protein 3